MSDKMRNALEQTLEALEAMSDEELALFASENEIDIEKFQAALRRNIERIKEKKKGGGVK